MGTVGGAKFAQPPWRFATRLGHCSFGGAPSLPPAAEGRHVTTTRPISLATRELPEADLDGIIAISTHSSDLRNNTRPSFNHRDGDDDAVSIIDLRHSDFSTEKSDRHNNNPHKERK
jgi:hypothetical protein